MVSSLMKQLIFRATFILLFSITSIQATGVIYQDLPEKGEFVIDQTDTLKPAPIDKLNNISDKLWQEKKIPIVTVMITSLRSMAAGSQSIEHYTQDLFNH